ncbi:MAG: hypothetical protein M3362_23160 [Acidobacteriota bacterium]|nr:hypothetical protein [Acidobacteriota bacterium]
MLDRDEASERVPVERGLFVDDDERRAEQRRLERDRAEARDLDDLAAQGWLRRIREDGA